MMTSQQKLITLNRRENKPEIFKELLSNEIPPLIWDTEADSFQNIGLTDDNNLIFIINNGDSSIIRNAKDKSGEIIKWKWNGPQPIFNRLTDKKLVFFASGVAEWLILDWLRLDYIVLPSDNRKNKISEFKEKLNEKALIILPDNDASGSFKGVIETLKSTLTGSYVFNADFYEDKDFRDYCRRVLSDPENFEDKDAFIESLFYNIWTYVGGSEVRDDPVTEDNIFERIKEVSPLPKLAVIFYDIKPKEYAIFDTTLNYYKKEKVLEYIKNIYFKQEPSVKEANKKARNFLHQCPKYYTILDTTLPFGANGDNFNIFEPTDVMAYKVNDADRCVIDFGYLKENFSYTNILLGNLFNGEKLEYFLNWFSYILNTGKKTRNCIVLTGVQGTGKGLLYEFIIKKAFGESYCVNLLSHNIKSNFTGMLHNKLFFVGEEMEKWLSYGILDKLKAYITDTSIIIERKGIDSFSSENKFNMMIFSNSVTPVKIESSDRRYSVFKCDTPIKNIIDTDTLVKGLEEESQEFLRMVKSLHYDEKQATSLFESEERDIAKDGSLSEIELIVYKLRTGQFDEIIVGYPEAKDNIEQIRREIEEYNGYALTSSVCSLFGKVLDERLWKKLKRKLYIYFGKAEQKRLQGEGRGFCYKVINEKDLSKTAGQKQGRQMQYS